MTGPSHDQVHGDLTGYTVSLGQEQWTLDRFLGKHSDSSVTYRSHRANQEHIVRVFLKVPQHKPILSVHGAAPNITTYTGVGTANLNPPTGNLARIQGRRAWVAVRKYVSATLKDALLAPNVGVNIDPFRVAVEVAQGLSTLHGQGLVHGDLRPSNISFGSAGVNLIDYGLDFNRPVRSYESRYLAPEYLIRGGEKTPSADIYSYGKLLRSVSRSELFIGGTQRDLILEVIDRCLETNPAARPSIDNVLELLNSNSRASWSAAHLKKLRFAIVADIDARLPMELSDKQRRSVGRHIADRCRRVSEDFAKYSSARAAVLSEIEMVHFLSTATLLDEFSSTFSLPSTSSNGILKGVELSFETNSVQAASGSERSLLDVRLDPEWGDEIRRDVLADVEGLNMGESEITKRIADQLAAAKEVTDSVLKSDVFLNSQEVALILSARCPGATSDEVRILKDLGYLLAVPVSDRNLYPLFQFDEDGLPLDLIKDVLDGMDSERSVWSRAIWWFLETPRLNGESPVSWLRGGGDKVSVSNLFRNMAA
ncbi:hypothetical protein CH254_04545 [Rhodococcus sp. 06-412-2C]|uniref:protein kinase domain-containing protein n=1 Tax=unclassified Rhodococcus (in: high G+C Gram-positive bacteria) TaxID=192944 RepID=UPI000B9BDD7D|nr:MULTISPECIES: serine/threonine-protein kinase [unclassified Rhodococcus (in: high G+C Gram-positive bacteria)]OZC91753.1 hypothetical protein CH254_04545 [Rhodococcus sp. 06-412-2C]OZC92321.1 hypothetical protein CH279_25820 [Rhodococcus sp. 06-412-2B]